MIPNNFFRVRQIRNCPRHLQNPIVGSRAQIQIRHRKLQQFHRRFIQSAVSLQFPAPHPRVASELRLLFEPHLLALARGDHTVPKNLMIKELLSTDLDRTNGQCPLLRLRLPRSGHPCKRDGGLENFDFENRN